MAASAPAKPTPLKPPARPPAAAKKTPAAPKPPAPAAKPEAEAKSPAPVDASRLTASSAKGTSNRAVMLRRMLQGQEVDFTLPPDLAEHLTVEQIRLLQEPTPAAYIKKHPGRGGVQFSYVPIALTIERMNMIFGYAWSAHIEKEAEVNIKGKLVAVWVRGYVEIVCQDGTRLQRPAFGGNPVEYQTERGADGTRVPSDMPVSVPDAFKSATSDMIGKACSGFGLWLDLYDKEGDIGRERTLAAEQNEQIKTQAAAAPAGSSILEHQPKRPTPPPVDAPVSVIGVDFDATQIAEAQAADAEPGEIPTDEPAPAMEAAPVAEAAAEVEEAEPELAGFDAVASGEPLKEDEFEMPFSGEDDQALMAVADETQTALDEEATIARNREAARVAADKATQAPVATKPAAPARPAPAKPAAPAAPPKPAAPAAAAPAKPADPVAEEAGRKFFGAAAEMGYTDEKKIREILHAAGFTSLPVSKMNDALYALTRARFLERAVEIGWKDASGKARNAEIDTVLKRANLTLKGNGIESCLKALQGEATRRRDAAAAAKPPVAPARPTAVQ